MPEPGVQPGETDAEGVHSAALEGGGSSADSDSVGDVPTPDLDLFGKAPKKHRDWSHRRREPRGLAFMWTLYLMLATMVSLMPMVIDGQLSATVYRPAARTMAVLVVVGLGVLWPVVRASQAPQRGAPVLDVLRDWSVLVVPALVLLWPQVLLAGWPVPVVGAVSVTLLVWMGVSGVILMWWHRFSDGGWAGRAGVAGVCVLLAAGIPMVLLATGTLAMERAGGGVSRGWMWSPVTGVWEVLRSRAWSGTSAAVFPGHWAVLRAQGVTVGGALIGSAMICRAGRGRRGHRGLAS